VSKSGNYSGGRNLPFSLSRTAGWPWRRWLLITSSGGLICRQGSFYRSRGLPAASEASGWTLALILSPAAAVISHFFANFKQCLLIPRRLRRRSTSAAYFCLGLRHQVPTHIQHHFLFENKAPIDVQIKIHIEKLCFPRGSSGL
jgi:hypothetical protein